jgi:hypothetical protein
MNIILMLKLVNKYFKKKNNFKNIYLTNIIYINYEILPIQTGSKINFFWK